MLNDCYKILNPFSKYVVIVVMVFLCVVMTSCSRKTPIDTHNICSIFDQKKRWAKYAKKSAKKWGTPVHVQMAILRQESGFRYNAKPERKKILGFIPWKRKSSAYGYAQVLNQTWQEYIKETKNRGADRDKFKDAIDFVGWYTSNTHKQINISKWDAHAQYLAYHEGRTGYVKRTYQGKKWLNRVARKVDETSKNYAAQLKNCR